MEWLKNNVKMKEIKGKIGISKGNSHYANTLVIFTKEREQLDMLGFLAIALVIACD